MVNKNSQEVCIAQMKKDIDFIKEAIKRQPTKDEMFLAIQDGVAGALKECDKKYAGKLTEKIVYTFVGMVLTAVFGSLIYLVVQ